MGDFHDGIHTPRHREALYQPWATDPTVAESLTTVCQLATNALDVPSSFIVIAEATTEFIAGGAGLPSDWPSNQAFPREFTTCSIVVESNANLAISDVGRSDRAQGDPLLTRLGAMAYLGVPIVGADGRAIGAFAVIDRQPRAWTGRDGDMLGRLADLASRSIVQAIHANGAEDRAKRAGRENLQLTGVLDRIGDAIIAIDREWRFTYLNREAQRFYANVVGLPADQLIGKDIWSASPPAMRELFYERFHRAVVEQAPIEIEEYYGRIGRWIESRTYPSDDGLTVYFRDTTHRKRVEEALHESEERFRQVVEGVHDYAIVVLDPSGQILTWNTGAERINSYAADEAIGQSHAIFYLPEDIEQGQPERLLDQAEEKGHAEDEGWRIRKDGTRFWADVAITALRDRRAALRGFTVVTRDTTARKRATDALRFLAEASNVLSSSLDYEATLEQVVRLAVPRLADWCAVYDIDEDSAPESPIRRLAVAHADPSKRRLVDELRQKIILRRDAPWGIARVLRTGQRELLSVVPESHLAQVVQDADHLRILRELGYASLIRVPLIARGHVLGAISFVKGPASSPYEPLDVPLAEDLALRAALALDNALLHRQAREAIRDRDAFFASVSHDLRGPLANIKGYAQFLQMKLRTGGVIDLAAFQDGLAKIDSHATKLSTMIGELLDLARLQMGTPLTLTRQPTNLVALVRQCAGEFQQTTERHRIQIVSDLAELIGNWDAARLERVVANLLSNAIKYSPNGGVVKLEIDVADDARGNWAVLAVHDEGIGIPARDVPRLFERFQRAHNVAGHIGGIGIGLTSVKQIVDLHGGEIRVASTEGIGSTFTVRLPLSPRSEEPSIGTRTGPRLIK